MSIAKLLLVGADKEPKVLSMLSDMSINKAEQVETSRDQFAEAITNIEPEVEAIWPTPFGQKTIPLEVAEADVLYVALSGKHSIISAAAIFNAAGINWTLSAFEAVNFGAFLGDPARAKKISQRIIAEATRLKVKEVAIVECGTAFRVLKQQMGQFPFEVVTFVDLIARYHREGKIKLNKTMTEKITYHDPCQIGRNAGVYEAPRYVLQQLTNKFVDMVPNCEENWCCGGGGGLVAAGDFEFRMKSSKVKVDQMKNSGASIVATACENCHSQLHDLCDYYSTGQTVEFISHLAARALKG
jgi:Fe-S oxidoreductase